MKFPHTLKDTPPYTLTQTHLTAMHDRVVAHSDIVAYGRFAVHRRVVLDGSALADANRAYCSVAS